MIKQLKDALTRFAIALSVVIVILALSWMAVFVNWLIPELKVLPVFYILCGMWTFNSLEYWFDKKK